MLWYILAFFAGAFVGFGIAALLVVASEEGERR